MIKRFSEYNNINENFTNNIESEFNNSYGDDFAEALYTQMPFKSISGDVDSYEVTFDIELMNGNKFGINILWAGGEGREDWKDGDTDITIDIGGKKVKFNDYNLEEIAYDMTSHDKEVVGKLIKLLKQEEVIEMYSVVLGTEGYSEASKVFYSEEEAREWLESGQVIKGSQIEGKRIGVTVENPNN